MELKFKISSDEETLGKKLRLELRSYELHKTLLCGLVELCVLEDDKWYPDVLHLVAVERVERPVPCKAKL